MSDNEEKLAEVLELSCRLMDEQLDEAGRSRLNELMFGDPAACEVYLNVATLHGHLHREFAGSSETVGLPAEVSASLKSRTIRPPTARRSWWRWASYAAAAAIVLAVGVLALVILQATHLKPDAGVATLVESQEVRWADGSPAYEANARLSPGALAIASGTIVVRFDNGAIATMTGPGELNIESRKTAELKSGNVLVRCDADAAGFTLRTAASDYIDLGTEFGVSVNPDASSEVHVFEGVVVARPRASGLVVPVHRSEAGRVEPARGDLVVIDTSAARFTGVRTPATTRPTTQAAEDADVNHIPRNSRIVFIGDNATDFETHLLLINQAFDRIYPDGDRPKIFNAGVTMPLNYTGDDLQRHVLIYKPTHAVIEFGPEIAANTWRQTRADFDMKVRRMVDALIAAGVEPIITTGFKLGGKQVAYQGLVDSYNEVLRKIAAEKRLRLADVDQHFRSLEKYKLPLVAPQGAVPTFAGAREMAFVLMDAMGHPGTRLDYTVNVGLLPGTITRWVYHLKPSTELIDSMRASMLTPDSTWKDLYLPQPEDKFSSRVSDPTHSPMNRDRARGFATNLMQNPNQMVEAVATFHSRDARTAYVNVGANVRTVFVNGIKVYDSQGKWNGWHAGKERVPATLQAGENLIVVEAGPSFFVSITDTLDWALE